MWILSPCCSASGLRSLGPQGRQGTPHPNVLGRGVCAPTTRRPESPRVVDKRYLGPASRPGPCLFPVFAKNPRGREAASGQIKNCRHSEGAK